MFNRRKLREQQLLIGELLKVLEEKEKGILKVKEAWDLEKERCRAFETLRVSEQEKSKTELAKLQSIVETKEETIKHYIKRVNLRVKEIEELKTKVMTLQNFVDTKDLVISHLKKEKKEQSTERKVFEVMNHLSNCTIGTNINNPIITVTDETGKKILETQFISNIIQHFLQMVSNETN